MSRKGNKLIQIESGVEVKVDGGVVHVKGPKGELEIPIRNDFSVEITENTIKVLNNSKRKDGPAHHGLYQSLISNMVEGVSKGFESRLELFGVGYRVQKKGSGLEFSLGYSHPVIFEPMDGITLEIDGQTNVIIKGIDKEKVGRTTDHIIKLRNAKKDPYKGKGVRQKGAILRKKAGKKVK